MLSLRPYISEPFLGIYSQNQQCSSTYWYQLNHSSALYFYRHPQRNFKEAFIKSTVKILAKLKLRKQYAEQDLFN